MGAIDGRVIFLTGGGVLGWASARLFAREGARHISEAGGGAVANMSSFVHAVGSTKPQDAYAASRGRSSP